MFIWLCLSTFIESYGVRPNVIVPLPSSWPMLMCRPSDDWYGCICWLIKPGFRLYDI